MDLTLLPHWTVLHQSLRMLWPPDLLIYLPHTCTVALQVVTFDLNAKISQVISDHFSTNCFSFPTSGGNDDQVLDACLV